MSQYTLMHKDSEVITFELKPTQLYKELINPIIHKDYLTPIGIDINNLESELYAWIESRRIPNNRANMKQLLSISNIVDIEDYIRLTKLISLNDVYWIRDNSTKAIKWEQVSPYRNSISNIIATTAFTGKIPNNLDIANYPREYTTNSPEYTTNGCLAKCWVRDSKGIIKLYKAGSKDNEDMEVYNEYFASQVAKQLNIPHVEYNIQFYKERLISVCECFTNESIGFIPLHRVYRYSLNLESIIKWFNRTPHMSQFTQHFCDIVFFDSVILNTDRHAGNIGFLIDNVTNEIIGVSHAFDHGLSFMDSNRESSMSQFHVSHQAIFEYLKTPERLSRIAKLEGIEQHSSFKLATSAFIKKQNILRNLKFIA